MFGGKIQSARDCRRRRDQRCNGAKLSVFNGKCITDLNKLFVAKYDLPADAVIFFLGLLIDRFHEPNYIYIFM